MGQESCNAASGWDLLQAWQACILPLAAPFCSHRQHCAQLQAMADCHCLAAWLHTPAGNSSHLCCGRPGSVSPGCRVLIWLLQADQAYSCPLMLCRVGCDTCLRPAAGESKFAEASDAYEAAGEVEAVVRLNLDKLRNPHKAAALARRSKSVGAAALVAQYCVVAGDFQVSAGPGTMSSGCSPACPGGALQSGLSMWLSAWQLSMAYWPLPVEGLLNDWGLLLRRLPIRLANWASAWGRVSRWRRTAWW